MVIVKDQEARALIDSGSQLSAISLAWVKKLKLAPWQLQSILQIEGSGWLDVHYLGYVETLLRIPQIKAFDNDILLLIVPDSVDTHHMPITLGTPHTDMAIGLATKKELEDLSKQWKRSLIGTNLTMNEAHVVNSEGTRIVSKIDNILKIARDATIVPFGMIEAKGAIETPNHYKCVNVVVDNLPENQSYKDIVIAQQIQVLKPGSNKIPVVIRNLSCRTLKLKKGMKIACVEASNIIPLMVSSQMPENVLKCSEKHPTPEPTQREGRSDSKDFAEFESPGCRVLE